MSRNVYQVHLKDSCRYIVTVLLSLISIDLSFALFSFVEDMSKSKSALLSILPHVPYIHTEN